MSLTITRPDGSSWTFDAELSTSPEVRVSLTQYPIEDGSDGTDHAQRMPDQYRIRGLVTATPREQAGGPVGQARLTAAKQFLAGCVGQFCTLTSDTIGRVEDALLGPYSTEHDNRRRLEITMTWQAAQVAVSQSITIPAPVVAVEPQLSDEQDAGAQAPETVDELAGERSIVAAFLGF